VPSLTASPSWWDQPVIVPDFMVRPHFGMVTIVGIVALLNCAGD
jgi:hypothetical protein